MSPRTDNAELVWDLLKERAKDRIEAEANPDALQGLAEEVERTYFNAIGGRYVGPNVVKGIYNLLRDRKNRLVDFEAAAQAVRKHLYKLKHWTERDRYYFGVLRTLREEREG